jgi:hypothetical protein
VPRKPKFTRIPKVSDLMLAGVPPEALATYAAIADHTNNKSGLAWPSMRRVGQIIGRSTRTVSRHVHKLVECGVLELVERRRHKGRFSSYLFKVDFIATSGHERPLGKRGPIYRGTKRIMNTPNPPQESQEEHRRREAAERRAGYEWLFE